MTSKLETVYIIDDEQDVRDALQMLLKSIGLTVETFSSAVDFLDQYQMEWPGCILVDIRMPGMSGMELQKKLNAMGAPIPVIVISGHADVPTAVRVIQEGAVDLLEKPVSEQDLLDKVQSAINSDRDMLAVGPGTPHFVEASSPAGCQFMIVQGVGEYDYVPVKD